MTVQEAYAELISIRNHIEDGYLTHLSYGGKADKQEEYTIKAYNVAINALEKQIPKKPIFESEQTSPFGVDDVPFYDWEEMIEVRNVAIKALEKQIPKKVTKSACPSCNRVFLFRHSEKRKGDYCDNCGQALDWSENNA